jgi:ketosteroid isomerase-like protein
MTEQELEVWQTVVAMNRAWTTGHVDELLNYFHPDIVAITPADRLRIQGREACIAAWAAFVAAAKIIEWKEREPVVHVFADTAIVTYYYDAKVEIDGEMRSLAGRDMLFMAKEADRWWVVADQFSADPGGSGAA